MSAIDCLTHVHVANFYGIPVYWLQLQDARWPATIDTSDITDQETGVPISPNILCIGGGSGEHPALVIEMDKNCRWTLKQIIKSEDELTEKENKRDIELVTKVSNLKRGSCWYDLDLNQWPLDTWVKIGQHIKTHPDYEKVKPQNNSVEKLIKLSIAFFVLTKLPYKFILNHDPELVSIIDLMFKCDFQDCDHCSSEIYSTHDFETMAICDISSPFPYNTSGSRKNPETGKIKWGFSLWQWYELNPEYKPF